MSDADQGFKNSLACESCRQRKRRCDRQLPCGLCARRGLACITSTPKAQGQGLIAGLEKEVARLEAQASLMQGLQASPDSTSTSVAQVASPAPVDLSVLKEVETVSFRGELYGLQKMTRRALQLDNSDPRGLSESRKSLVSSSSPSSSSSSSSSSSQRASEFELDSVIVARYADNFFSHVHPTFPILNQTEIRRIIHLTVDKHAAVEEQMLAHLVLALGAVLPQTSVLDAANSARHFLSAAEARFSYDESLDTARILLLFTIYSLFDPTTGSSWQLIDLAMQVCIVLGLHQLPPDIAGEEAQGATIFQAAYTLDFLISSALGLPMSTRNSDIALSAYTPSDEAILTPRGIYSWAYELGNSPSGCATDHLAAYAAHVRSRKSGEPGDAMPAVLGWHLAVQSLGRMTPHQAANLWQAVPTAPGLMLPWIAGYVAFQSILRQLAVCARAPELKPTLAESLSRSGLVLSSVAARFEGLKPHAELAGCVMNKVMRDDDGPVVIGFLQGSDLYEICAEALQYAGIGCDRNARVCLGCQRAKVSCIEIDPVSGHEYERGYVADLKARAARLRAIVNSPADPDSKEEAICKPAPAPVLSVAKTPRFSDGSIFSLGHLVAAALSVQFRNGSGFRIGPLTQQAPDIDIVPGGDQDLPPLSVACELTDTYLEVGFHRVSPFLSRRQVYEQIERLYDARRTTLSGLERRNDMFQLFMILAVGAPFSRRTLQDMAPIQYYASAMRYADVLSQTAGDVQIQNTLLLLTFAQQQATGIGSRWKLARQAMRICLQLGYHKASTRPLGVFAEQMRRRLFWCCYVQERYAARGLGRPMVVAESDITVGFPDHVNLDDDRPRPDPIRSEVSVLIRQAQLRRISTRVRDELYLARLPPQAKVEAANRLAAELEQWRLSHVESSVTPHSTCIFETREYMDVNYYRESMFIYSALVVPTGAELHAFRPDVAYLGLCVEPAVHIILLYQVMLQKGIQTTLWTWVQDILRSGFMILYCGIHISNILSGGGEKGGTNLPEPALIVRALDDCRQMLEDVSQQWAAVSPHWVAFDRLSAEVKQLMQRSSSPNDFVGRGELGDGVGDAQGGGVSASGIWDIPMNVAGWDDLMEGDLDMSEVFGFDFTAWPSQQ